MPRRRPDTRSAEAQAYRRLYHTARWKTLRLAHLRAEPLCRMCAQQGRITPATVVDHITPHRGDVEAFFNGPHQSLCQPCHDGPKQGIERRGYDTAVGPDGFPVDPRHPANR